MRDGYDGGQHIPLTASRGYQRSIVWIVNLAAETLDHHVDDVGHRFKCCVPDVLRDGRTPHHGPGMERQELEQRELS